MRKQDQVIALISSLTQGEKKYFVQRSRIGGGNKSYLKLYELLSRKDIYNTAELCRLLKKTKPALANEKKYLEKNLLAALREYHDNHPQLKTLNGIAEGILLMERNLPQYASSSVSRALKAATELNSWPLAWQANSLMLTLCSDPFMSYADSENQSKKYLKEMQSVAENIKLITDFELFSESVYAAYSQRPADITELHRRQTKKLLNHPLLKINYNSAQLLSYKYSLQSLLFARLGDYVSNVDTNRKILALYETSSQIDKMGHWTAVANLTQSLIMAGNRMEYNLWMQKLRSRYYSKLPVDGRYIDSMVKQFRSVFDSGAYFRFLANGEVSPETVQVFTRRVIRNYTAERNVVTPFHFVSLVYKTAACCLLIGDINDCVFLLRKLFDETSDSVNPIAIKNARILFLMVHAQMGNAVLFPSILQSFLSFAGKNRAISEAELLFVKQLALLAGTQSKKDRIAWYKQAEERLSQKRLNSDTKRLLEAIPVRKWVQINLSQ